MKKLSGLVAGFSKFLDQIAAFCIVLVMLLTVVNIILRVAVSRPILGAYEFVGYLTAGMIGLALASCALQNGHIAVSFVVDKFSRRIQACVDVFTNVLAVSFWGVAAWYIGKYAGSMSASGVVSPTSQIPFYPFIYLVSFGLVALCLVLVIRLFESIRKAAINK
ncbi:TRAP transporter small permease [Desulfotruncus alcoholivorax]|uniref:TRAP transporter small permease n=1 Tax=Desulfotruncus alcoholivorax TaxID=265477 RepID=UPI0004216B0C|nr:TRAP transporter small permease [Desulfotruncus alcoholivorax]